MQFSDYVSSISEADYKSGSRGRSMGGVLVGVRKQLATYVVRLCKHVKNAIFLKFSKYAFGTGKDIVLVCTYIPPPGSPFFLDKNISGFELIEDYLIQANVVLGEVHLMLCGDFNARTAELADFVSIDDEIDYGPST
jgi:hypothetical protein